jgi:hypothetical protein
MLWPCDTLYPQKLAQTLPTSGSRSVGIFHLWTKATEFSFMFFIYFQDLMSNWQKKKKRRNLSQGHTDCFLQRTSPSSHAWDE